MADGQIEVLFTAALGLARPWEVEKVELDEPPRLLRRPIGFSHAASGRQAELR